MASVAFSSSDEDVLQRTVEVTVRLETPAEKIDDVYETQRSADWIREGGFSKVALQFPDEMMCDSVQVTRKLEEKTNSTIFILGDTSYGSCCVDEVAAEHYNADCIIHYGRTCLSQTRRLPVLYVFGQMPVDRNDCIESFRSIYTDPSSYVVIMYDAVYSYAVEDIVSQLIHTYTNTITSRLDIPSVQSTVRDILSATSKCLCQKDNVTKTNCQPQDSNISSGNTPTTGNDSENTDKENVVKKCGRIIHLHETKSIADYNIFYIGNKDLTLTNLMMTFNSSTFSSYNPATRETESKISWSNKALMKRFWMVEKAKDARIVGIIVGTLGVADYLLVINRLKALIRRAGKKSYTFVVGKLNVPKLANFMEIDVFVLVACQENSLLDSHEFYKPVVTPYEMELACIWGREWSGKYVTDFRALLPGGTDYYEVQDEEGEETRTDISLITGKMRITGKHESPEIASNAVIPRNEALSITTVQSDSAGEFLSSRSWKGLEQQLGETAVSKAVEGRTGIASGYGEEGSYNN